MKKWCWVIKLNIDRLKEIRQDRDLQQVDIAKVLKTSQVQYSRYERGIRVMPIDKIAMLAKFYDVSIDYLLGLTDIRKPYPKSKINSYATKVNANRTRILKKIENREKVAI